MTKSKITGAKSPAIPLEKNKELFNLRNTSNNALQALNNNLQALNKELLVKMEELQKALKEKEDTNGHLTSLLLRANAENKRRNEVFEGFKKMLFKVGLTSEAGIVNNFIKNTKQEEVSQERPEIQTSLFGDDKEIFNELELMAPFANSTKELNLPKSKKQANEKPKSTTKKTKLSMRSEELLNLELPVTTVYLDDVATDSVCPICKNKMSVIGEEVVTRKLKYTPATWSVEEIRRRTYKCQECEKNNRKYLNKKAALEALLPHSIVSASTLAHIVTQKFVYGLPFYRQEQMMISNGIPLNRNILTSWCMKVFENQVAPLCELIKEELVKNNQYIHVDETRIEVLKSEGSKTPKQAYMWVYTTTKWNGKNIRYFEYEPGRSSKYPEEFLKDYRGYIHTDCYGGYNSLVKRSESKVKRCLCLVHLRRYFVNALEGKNNDSVNNRLAIKSIAMLDKVFENERTYKDLSSTERYKARQENTKPILEEFFEWCIKVQASNACLPKGKLGQAFDYALKGKEEFNTFLEDGNCDVSNNTVENAIRPFVIGRKNYLFHITDKGAGISAGYYSLVETAKANGLDPQKYFEWIFTELPNIRPKTEKKQLERLLPWSNKVPESCKANTIETLRNQNS